MERRCDPPVRTALRRRLARGYIDDATPERLLLSNDADFDRVDDVRAGVDAILVGANTIRADNPRLMLRSEERREKRLADGKTATPVKITISNSGDLDPTAKFFAAGEIDNSSTTRAQQTCPSSSSGARPSRRRCIDQAGTDGVMANTFAYTDLGPALRETLVTDSAGHSSRFLINKRSQVVSVTPPGDETRSAWDERNRLLTRTDPLGRTTSFSYDASGNLSAVTRPDGQQQTVAYTDAGGRPVPTRTRLADGSEWVFEYDEHGNRTAATDPLGATTICGFDQRGHLETVTDALGNVRTLETNNAGLPLVGTRASGLESRGIVFVHCWQFWWAASRT